MAKKELSNREKKLAAIRKADRARESEFDNLTLDEPGGKGIKTRERIGQYKRNRQGARDMSNSNVNRSDQSQTYNKNDGSSETFDKLDSSKGNVKSKRKQRSLDRESLRDARKERRATRIADRKGMSVGQAQDFMNNRRDRLNAAMGEFGKGLFGKEQDLSRIKDREYRKRGRGTRSEDYKPFADSNTRTKSTYYDGVIKPAKMIPLNPNISGDMGGLSADLGRKLKKKKTQKQIENKLEPTVPNYHKDVDSSDQMTSTVQSTLDPKVFTKQQQTINLQNDERLNQNAVDDYYGADGVINKMINKWFNSSGMTKPFNEQSRDKSGASTESFSDGDRNTTQENMSNEWKKKFPSYKG